MRQWSVIKLLYLPSTILVTRLFRSSFPEVFCKKGVLRNFAKFTGKYLCQSLFFNKVVGLRPATLLKKRLKHRCFPVNFAKFLTTPFPTEHLWWLLLTQKMRKKYLDWQWKVHCTLCIITHLFSWSRWSQTTIW